MGLTETAIIYSIIGLVVAAAMWLSSPPTRGVAALASFVVHTMLWPFFAPVLLGRAGGGAPAAPTDPPGEAAAYDPRVRAAEARLTAALASLDGTAEEVLDPEVHRVRELTDSLARMAYRLAEMDELLATPEFDEARALDTLDAICAPGGAGDEARADSVRARLRNIRRLAQMRQALSEDFERAILKVEEISSQIRLLRFADRPEDEVSGLIGDISATVEGLSEGLLAS